MNYTVLPDGSSTKWLSRCNNNKRICAIEDMFQAISDAHDFVGHKRVGTTKTHLDNMYDNIREKHVIKCLKLCPTCAKSNDNIRKKDKGPGISIKSFAFRSRIQVDLIDYKNDPREDFNGVKNEMVTCNKRSLH